MPILDIFKRKKKEKEIKLEKPREKLKEVKVEKPFEIVTQKGKRERVISEAWKVLKPPRVTEKATELAKQNQYVFKVYPKANKIEIKKAVEDLYGVNVIDVKILKVPRKRRRLGRIFGWRKGYKKAIVKIKKGQKIEVLPR